MQFTMQFTIKVPFVSSFNRKKVLIIVLVSSLLLLSTFIVSRWWAYTPDQFCNRMMDVRTDLPKYHPAYIDSYNHCIAWHS